MLTSPGQSTTECLLSIVIPAFNEASCIECTVEGFHEELSSLGLHHEMIVVDDASTDPTPQICATLLDRGIPLRILSHRTNGRIGSAIHTGLKAAEGRIILYTDRLGEWSEVEARLTEEIATLKGAVASASETSRALEEEIATVRQELVETAEQLVARTRLGEQAQADFEEQSKELVIPGSPWTQVLSNTHVPKALIRMLFYLWT